jgi:hypothetical protein
VHSTPQLGDDSFGFDVLGPLWYSSGGRAVPTTGDVTLTIQKSAVTPITVTGTSTFTHGFDLIGFSTHETSKYLDNWTADGAYGFAFQVTGHNAAGAPFIGSDPLVVVFATPDFDDPTIFDPTLVTAAGRAIYTAAVPLGDTNGDGGVDLEDFNNVQNHFHQTGIPVLGDTNGDGVVDLEDFNNVQNNYRAQRSALALSAVAVPEPSTLLLTGIGAGCMFFYWRRAGIPRHGVCRNGSR